MNMVLTNMKVHIVKYNFSQKITYGFIYMEFFCYLERILQTIFANNQNLLSSSRSYCCCSRPAFFCHQSEPLLKVSQVGTMVTITTHCKNPECGKHFVWKSQQQMPETRIYAGNFLLSFAILVAGSSASKVLQVMKHMGLACISLPTYFRHQRVSIIKKH